jgi:L-glyceraldehyde 3-phosphate reductase
MWPGPYGNWGSKKYLIASADQSLKRMKIKYFDIFYSHRPDPKTPIEETIEALAQLVHQGKALYAGISSYSSAQTREAYKVANEMGLKLLIHQPNYSMFDRWVEDEPLGDGLLTELDRLGMGAIVFAPLSQGMLSARYLDGIPKDSRAAKPSGALSEEALTPIKLKQIQALNDLAKRRGQTLSQMALAWVLQRPTVASALIGASRPEQILENVKALEHPNFSASELKYISEILAQNDLTNSDDFNSVGPWHYMVTHPEE